MLDFDFSSFSLIHLELKGNVFIRSRSLLTKPSLRSWWFKSVAVFGQELFNTLHPFWRHISPYVTYIGEYPLPANSLILNWSESNCWYESKLVMNSTYKSTKSPALKTFVSIFKNCKIYMLTIQQLLMLLIRKHLHYIPTYSIALNKGIILLQKLHYL